jgi:phosphopantothenoylcysteine decarboxylase
MRRNVLVCVSGSVATLKIPEIVVRLNTFCHVKLVLTTAGKHFMQKCVGYNVEMWNKFVTCGGNDMIITDEDEWNLWGKMGDPVLHIELRKWADVILIVPASADLISKISVGISDNLILCVLRACDAKKKKVVICPAMNTAMWEHPSTVESLEKISSWGFHVIQPVDKLLACKDKGVGALAPVFEIISFIESEVLKLDENVVSYVNKDVDYQIRLLKNAKNLKKNRNIGSSVVIFIFGVTIGILFSYLYLASQ